MQCTEPIPIEAVSETVGTVSEIHQPITVSETEVQTAVSEITVLITTEDSDRGMAVTEHSHNLEGSVIQTPQDPIITLSLTIIITMEASDPMTMEVSDQAEVLQAAALEEVLQVAV
jgi:hypothetical protein